MFFKRFYDDGLAQASYLIGCEGTGEAVVVDANRDVAQYVRAAAEEQLRITHVAETHIHADFVSGSRGLARQTGAVLILSGEGGPDWQYAFASGDGARLVRAGDTFSAGRVHFDVVHTPGHTPEHLSLLVTDLNSSDRPLGLLSGDFVFVGDVGRPDLLEKAAKHEGTMEASARALFHALQQFRELPDYVQLWPGHGAGSACGKALGAMPQSTVGYEKIANWGVRARDEEAFVREVLDGQPDPPPYFAEMKRINREGPPIQSELPTPMKEDESLIVRRLSEGGLVVDIRSAEAFASAHIPGTVSIPRGKAFTNWAGWLIPWDRDVSLIAESVEDATDAARQMAFIGLDRWAGWFGPEVMGEWTRRGRQLERVVQATAEELAGRIARGDVTVVDVRTDAEWALGHIPGALHIPLGYLAARSTEITASRPVVVQCQGGTRSAIAASILLSRGVSKVVDLRGGFAEWLEAGQPTTSD